jgi:hypothetical protein
MALAEALSKQQLRANTNSILYKSLHIWDVEFLSLVVIVGVV